MIQDLTWAQMQVSAPGGEAYREAESGSSWWPCRRTSEESWGLAELFIPQLCDGSRGEEKERAELVFFMLNLPA